MGSQTLGFSQDEDCNHGTRRPSPRRTKIATTRPVYKTRIRGSPSIQSHAGGSCAMQKPSDPNPAAAPAQPADEGSPGFLQAVASAVVPFFRAAFDDGPVQGRSTDMMALCQELRMVESYQGPAINREVLPVLAKKYRDGDLERVLSNLNTAAIGDVKDLVENYLQYTTETAGGFQQAGTGPVDTLTYEFNRQLAHIPCARKKDALQKEFSEGIASFRAKVKVSRGVMSLQRDLAKLQGDQAQFQSDMVTTGKKRLAASATTLELIRTLKDLPAAEKRAKTAHEDAERMKGAKAANVGLLATLAETRNDQVKAKQTLAEAGKKNTELRGAHQKQVNHSLFAKFANFAAEKLKSAAGGAARPSAGGAARPSASGAASAGPSASASGAASAGGAASGAAAKSSLGKEGA